MNITKLNIREVYSYNYVSALNWMGYQYEKNEIKKQK